MQNDLVDPLLKSGNVFKLKCQCCNNISVQITESENPDTTCLECGNKCEIIK